jgi:hypothetical protein
MIENPEGKRIVQQAESEAALGNQSTGAFLEELAKDHHGLLKMAANSCQIYKTKSDCDWHPPCHWNDGPKACGGNNS